MYVKYFEMSNFITNHSPNYIKEIKVYYINMINKSFLHFFAGKTFFPSMQLYFCQHIYYFDFRWKLCRSECF